MPHIEKSGSHAVFSLPYVNLGLALRSDDAGSHVDLLKSEATAETRQQMVQAGKQFEAYFISYLLKVMRETVPDGTLANKPGAYFYSFYDEEIGKRAAESGGIGIAKMVEDYYTKQCYASSSPLKHSSSPGLKPIRSSMGVKPLAFGD